MKNNNVELLAYEDMYQFACKAESVQDFIERMQIISNTVILELADRIEKYQPQTAHKVASIIDSMQEEIIATVSNINSTKIVDKQPLVMEDILFNLIRFNNYKIYSDYIYIKRVFPN